MNTTFAYGDTRYELTISPADDGGYVVSFDGAEYVARLETYPNGEQALWLDGVRFPLAVVRKGEEVWVACGGDTFALTREARTHRRASTGDVRADNELRAPMPGNVRGILVEEGEVVERGQTLLLLEAMKMEMRIQAPCDGKIKALFVSPDEQVEIGKILIELELDP